MSCNYCRYDFTERLGAKLQLQMAPEKGMSQSMFDLEFKVRAGQEQRSAWQEREFAQLVQPTEQPGVRGPVLSTLRAGAGHGLEWTAQTWQQRVLR